jgi:hypothetical protein
MSDVPTHPQNTVVTTSDLITSEVQKWTLVGVGAAKKWTVDIDGEKSTSATLVGNAAASAVQTALEKLSNFEPGDVTVTGSAGGPYTVTYANNWEQVDVPAPTFTAEEGEITLTVVTAGGAASLARQKGTGLADRTAETSPRGELSPAAYRAANPSKYD